MTGSSLASAVSGFVPLPLVAIYAAFLGAALASFLGVVAERIPAGNSIRGRSACVCGRQLTARDMVPVLSWVAMRGKARCCGSQVPVRYVAAEAILGFVFAAAAVGPVTIGGALFVAAGSVAVLLAATWGA